MRNAPFSLMPWIAGLALLLMLTASRDARASEEGYLGAALVGLAGVTVVAPIGAMVKVIEENPSKVWGRASMVSGAIATATGAGLLIASAYVDETEQTLYTVLGAVSLGLGIHGLLWGTVTEIAVADDDPGLEAQPRRTPSMITIEGQF